MRRTYLSSLLSISPLVSLASPIKQNKNPPCLPHLSLPPFFLPHFHFFHSLHQGAAGLGLESGTAVSACLSKNKSNKPLPFNLGSNRRLSVTPRALSTVILASSKRRVTFFMAFSSERCLMRAVSNFVKLVVVWKSRGGDKREGEGE